MKHFGIGILFILFVFGFIGYREVYGKTVSPEEARFDVRRGESAAALAERLKRDGKIRSTLLFRALAASRGIDRTIQAGEYVVSSPATLHRILAALTNSLIREEKTITIIPGWDIRDIADYFEREGVVSSTEFYRLAGEPARLKMPAYQDFPTILAGKPSAVSLEGYLAPNTYRIFADATGEEIIRKLIEARAGEFDSELLSLMASSKRSMHDVLTIASIVEREVRSNADRAKVADIFWRRFDAGWGLQADSTVHYAVGKKGDLFTTKEDRDKDNPWNTYKYAGLPPGPIGSPSVAAIRTALNPEKNPHWYFLTTLDGDVKYAKTIEEHTRNVVRYLR